LHAAEKEEGGDDGFHLLEVAVQQPDIQHAQAHGEAGEGAEGAQQAYHLQGHDGYRSDHVESGAEQFKQAVFAGAVAAFGMAHGHLLHSPAEHGRVHGQVAAPVRELQHVFDQRAPESFQGTAVVVYLEPGDMLRVPVQQTRRALAEQTVMAVDAPAADHVAAVGQFFVEQGDVLGENLQVGINHKDIVTPGAGKAGINGGALAEIPGQAYHAPALVLPTKGTQQFQGPVAAAVVHGNDFIGLAQAFKGGCNTLVQLPETGFLIIDRNNEGQHGRFCVHAGYPCVIVLVCLL